MLSIQTESFLPHAENLWKKGKIKLKIKMYENTVTRNGKKRYRVSHNPCPISCYNLNGHIGKGGTLTSSRFHN